MLEIRFHSRGGQGAKTAATILAEAFGNSGCYVQAFPDFGPEREGAPMKTYLRIDSKPIRIVEGIKAPNLVVVLDETLLEEADIKAGMSDGTITIVNICDSGDRVKEDHSFKGKVLTINASEIAQRVIGKPVPSAVITGSILKALNNKELTIEQFTKFVEKAFVKKFGEKIAKANVTAIKEGYSSAI